MRYFYYTNYQSGGSGLSNGIMSIEIGVILAHLTNRLLVLDGNVPPPANVVSYDHRVSNERPSRITDLVEIPVPWVEPNAVDLAGLTGLELTNRSLWEVAFYFPKSLDLSSKDARAFARDRDHWITVTAEHDKIPVLRLSEEPLLPDGSGRRCNLGFYSYQFYFDNETRRSVYRLLQRMQAKRPYVELAERVARDLGSFNAVHLRRGDFKLTYGVTTLDRKPSEALDIMDQVFGRKERLVILTDERNDPFFTEIKLAYPNHVFIDWHILDHYGAEFARLPQSDSLSLAFLSQLVAAEAKEFIGTMTSTFTALIQRYRGNRGRNEVFRYLWNELPEAGQGYERGRHAISDCIPLERGVMVEQFEGPYSWNRVSPLLNPAWMREWPESFLLPEVVATGALATKVDTRTLPAHPATATRQPVLHVTFEKLQVAIRSNDAAMLKRLAPELGTQPGVPVQNVVASLDVSVTSDGCWIQQRGVAEKVRCDKSELSTFLKRRIGTIFALARHRYAWLAAATFARDRRGLLIAGDGSAANDAFRRGLLMNGWDLLDDSLVAIRGEDLMLVPIGAKVQPEGAAAAATRTLIPLERILITTKAPLHARSTAIAPMAPAAAVAALIGSSIDFNVDKHRAVELLCRVIERRPAAHLHFSRPEEAARTIARWANAPVEGTE